ncbi:MAG TPA: methyltransferase domain-containing protein [Thermomicrobiaceae bacterium]|nr:methyltransferase domain-containing protein [Thermomicrobiaceae bacterium]
MGRDHPFIAALYGPVMEPAERGWLGRRRAAVVARARGDVLEIGGGTGANLSLYGPAVRRLVVTEPDAAMRRRLTERAAGLPRAVAVGAARAEALPFPDASFDTLVATLVLCSVDDLGTALGEARRVLRPGGRLLFFEHVRGTGWRGRLQDAAQPVWSAMVAGCRPNRDSVAGIAAAGFRLAELEVYKPNPTLPILVPMAEGIAVR